jgi:hypothetical protein
VELLGEYKVDPVYGCHLWTGMCDRDGYAIDRRGRRVHRLVYAEARGPIPTDHEIDHGCRRRHCLRPEHLEAVTRSENGRRKSFRRRSRKRKCAAGHDAFTHGRLTPEAGRVCLACAPVEVAA